MNNPTIRQAVSTDVPSIIHCVHEAYAHYIERIGKKPGPMLDDYAAIIANHTVFVAEHNQTMCGVLVLIEEAGQLLLDNIAVRPTCQKKGIGKLLLQLAERIARERGHSAIMLYTHEKMSENIELYGRIGYTEHLRKKEKGYDRVYMIKSLSL